MLLQLLRFFKGYVRFRAKGRSPERFINLTAQNGISLWDAHPVAGGIKACMTVRDYRNIRKTARKASVTTRITKKRGVPFLAAKYRGRIGIPVGAALGIVLLIVLSRFIWTIDINGTEYLSEAKLRTLLGESGVKIGADKYYIDTDKVKRDILLEVEELSWLSVNIYGCHADVEFKEKTKKPELDETDSPCNLKAAQDGVITGITAGEGKPQVKVGSGVAKGDLLVSGVTLTKDNKIRCVRARGEVCADVISEKEIKLPKSYIYNSISENKSDRFRLSFLGAQLPCSLSFRFFDNEVYTRSESFLNVGGKALPLGFVTETAHEVTSVELRTDREQARKVFNKSLMLFEVFEKSEAKIVSKDYEITETPDSYVCEAKLVFNENIAEPVDFSAEE